MTAPIAPGLSTLVENRAGVILDLWGVIHDGVAVYPAVAETLACLRKAGKRSLMLSNAPRRAAALIDQLSALGLDRGLYDAVLSSGEAVFHGLDRRDHPDFAGLGRRLYHLGPERDRNIFEGLPYEETGLDQADFLLNTGPVDLGETVDDYRDLLGAARARDLPMLCANPDREVIRQGHRVICAGALADHYRGLGGRVIERGKPDPAIYADALALLDIADPGRVIAVGDALHTDIRGARAAGLDGVLIAGGIHAEALGITWGQSPAPDRLDALIRHHGDRPVAVLPRLCW